MDTLEARLESLLAKPNPTLYEVCLDVGIDYSNSQKILYRKRNTTFEKRLSVLEKICENSLIELDFDLLSALLAGEHLPERTVNRLINEAKVIRGK